MFDIGFSELCLVAVLLSQMASKLPDMMVVPGGTRVVKALLIISLFRLHSLYFEAIWISINLA